MIGLLEAPRITRSTIYEKLRKRSYRQHLQSNLIDDWDGLMEVMIHEAYLDGVRDALEEVIKQGELYKGRYTTRD